jgi:hypothetical protein
MCEHGRRSRVSCGRRVVLSCEMEKYVTNTPPLPPFSLLYPIPPLLHHPPPPPRSILPSILDLVVSPAGK